TCGQRLSLSRGVEGDEHAHVDRRLSKAVFETKAAGGGETQQRFIGRRRLIECARLVGATVRVADRLAVDLIALVVETAARERSQQPKPKNRRASHGIVA